MPQLPTERKALCTWAQAQVVSAPMPRRQSRLYTIKVFIPSWPTELTWAQTHLPLLPVTSESNTHLLVKPDISAFTLATSQGSSLGSSSSCLLLRVMISTRRDNFSRERSFMPFTILPPLTTTPPIHTSCCTLAVNGRSEVRGREHCRLQ
jgi:hypothetical protein